MYENNKTYYHFNFTTKANKADDVNPFFAEVMCIKNGYAVTCCCMIKPKDDGITYFYSTLTSLFTWYWYEKMLHGCTLLHLITRHLLNMDKFTATGCCDKIRGFHYPELTC